MYIPQLQLNNLKLLSAPNKVIIIYGPRRCGKTTLLKQYIDEIKTKFLFVSGEDIIIREFLSSESINKLKGFVGANEVLIIDEAQKIDNIGLNLKLIIDHIPGIKIIVSGSSSFDLASNTSESLTGRKYILKLFPLAQLELKQIEQVHETQQNLENRLIFGSYPEIILQDERTEKERYLREIVGSYLYKDVLELDGVRHSDKIIKILRLLAFQIGKDVAYSEIASRVSLSKNTVERYLDILEKAFVVFKLTGFSRNLRKEVSKSPRYFFFDNGIRNALINNFNSIQVRDDIGMLWENYLIVERIKKQEYTNLWSNNYFWRTYDKKEIDFVEERGGTLRGFEFKWNPKINMKLKQPKDWLTKYNNSSYEVITPENYLSFIG